MHAIMALLCSILVSLAFVTGVRAEKPQALATAGGPFTEQHRKAIASLADKHGFVMPDYEFETPGKDVPEGLQRFIGIWIDTAARGGTSRKLMLIVTRVDKEGKAHGYHPFGSAGPKSFSKAPAGVHTVRGTITADTLTFFDSSGKRTYKFTLTAANRMNHFYSNERGQTRSDVLLPFWTLIEAKQSAKR
jgi:hypothetical protein